MTKPTTPRRPKKTKADGKKFTVPFETLKHLKVSEARMEFECRKQAAVFATKFIKHREEYWNAIREKAAKLPPKEKTKLYSDSYAPLRVYHLMRDNNLRIEWWEEHHKSGNGKTKRRKYIKPTKGGKSYDTKKLLSKAKDFEAELVKNLEQHEYRRIRAMWDKLRELRKLIKDWKKLASPNMLNVNMNDTGDWTLQPHTVTSEYGLEELAKVTSDKPTKSAGDTSYLEAA